MKGDLYPLEICRYDSSLCREIVTLFLETVHTVNRKDYTPDQLDGWAPPEQDLARWDRSLQEHYTLVAINNHKVVGFGDISADGYLDRLYVQKDHQGEGIATALCDRLEAAVNGKRIVTHASITARPFFEKRGYHLIQSQQVERCGVLLDNYVMEKRLPQENL